MGTDKEGSTQMSISIPSVAIGAGLQLPFYTLANGGSWIV
jgi:hypothetical protein